MKNAIKHFVVLPLILLCACETAKFSIDDPANVKIDTRLIGSWQLKKVEKTIYVVSKSTDYLYQIAEKKKKKSASKSDTMSAFLSKVEDCLFLNIYQKDSTQNGYLLLRIINIKPKGDTIMIAAVSDSSLKGISSSAEMRKYVTANLNRPSFYSDTGYLYKLKK